MGIGKRLIAAIEEAPVLDGVDHFLLEAQTHAPWILGRSATGSREADLSVFAKLFEDRLKWRLEAETFSRR